MVSHWVAGATRRASRGLWSTTPLCHISGMSPRRLSRGTACHSARTRARCRSLGCYGLSCGKTGIHMHAGLPSFSSAFLCFVHLAELRLGSTWGYCLFELVSDMVPHSQALHLASGGYVLVLQPHVGLHCCVFRAHLFDVFCSCLQFATLTRPWAGILLCLWPFVGGCGSVCLLRDAAVGGCARGPLRRSLSRPPP